MIRIAMIGCGGMAGAYAKQMHHAFEGRAKLTVVVDIDKSRAEAAAKDCNCPDVEAATDYRTVMDKFDAALLVLPHHLHHPIAKACLEAGKHVLLEKPMANTEQECLDLIETSKRCDRVLMIAYPLRFWPTILKLKEIIDSKEYGELFSMSLWTEQYTRREENGWAHRAETLGGGQLFSHGCHYIDVMLWFLGNPVQGTHVGTNLGTEWMEREGTSHVSIKFESGATGYHFGTWGARGTKLGYSFHLHFTKGMIEFPIGGSPQQLILHRFPGTDVWEKDDAKGGDIGAGAGSEMSRQTVLFEYDDKGKHVDLEMGHFLDCIEKGLQPETDGYSSLQGLRVIWKLYEAEEKGVVADLRGLGLPRQ